MISVICCTMRQDFMENVFNNYENQDVREKELIIILNKDDMDRGKWEQRAKSSKGVTIDQLSEKTTLGECLNYAINKCKYDIIAKFDDDDYYSPFYLSQQTSDLKKANADIVCKKTVFMYFEREKTLVVHLPNKKKNLQLRYVV